MPKLLPSARSSGWVDRQDKPWYFVEFCDPCLQGCLRVMLGRFSLCINNQLILFGLPTSSPSLCLHTLTSRFYCLYSLVHYDALT